MHEAFPARHRGHHAAQVHRRSPGHRLRGGCRVARASRHGARPAREQGWARGEQRRLERGRARSWVARCEGGGIPSGSRTSSGWGAPAARLVGDGSVAGWAAVSSSAIGPVTASMPLVGPTRRVAAAQARAAERSGHDARGHAREVERRAPRPPAPSRRRPRARPRTRCRGPCSAAISDGTRSSSGGRRRPLPYRARRPGDPGRRRPGRPTPRSRRRSRGRRPSARSSAHCGVSIRGQSGGGSRSFIRSDAPRCMTRSWSRAAEAGPPERRVERANGLGLGPGQRTVGQVRSLLEACPRGGRSAPRTRAGRASGRDSSRTIAVTRSGPDDLGPARDQPVVPVAVPERPRTRRAVVDPAASRASPRTRTSLPVWTDCCHDDGRILASGRRVTTTWTRAGSMSSTIRRICGPSAWAKASLLRTDPRLVAARISVTSSVHSADRRRLAADPPTAR